MVSKQKAKNYNLSVTKAIAIINLLAERGGYLSLSQIGKTLGLPLGSAHHLIASLKMERFVDQDPATRKYGIGLRLFEIGLSDNYYRMLAKRAGPALEKMSEETGESSNLAVLIDGQIVYIAQRQSSQMMKTFVQLGKRSPVHCTGVGKVLISELPEEEIEQIVQKHGLERYTAQTITSLEDLLEELKKVREQQFAIDEEEREEGVVCVAVPIYSGTGKIIAAISISGPRSRIKTKELSNIIELLKYHGQSLSRS